MRGARPRPRPRRGERARGRGSAAAGGGPPCRGQPRGAPAGAGPPGGPGQRGGRGAAKAELRSGAAGAIVNRPPLKRHPGLSVRRGATATYLRVTGLFCPLKTKKTPPNQNQNPTTKKGKKCRKTDPRACVQGRWCRAAPDRVRPKQRFAEGLACRTERVVAEIYFLLKNVRAREWGRVEDNIYQNTRRHLSRNKGKGNHLHCKSVRQRPNNNIYRKAFKNTMCFNNNNNNRLLQLLQRSLIKN